MAADRTVIAANADTAPIYTTMLQQRPQQDPQTDTGEWPRANLRTAWCRHPDAHGHHNGPTRRGTRVSPRVLHGENGSDEEGLVAELRNDDHGDAVEERGPEHIHWRLNAGQLLVKTGVVSIAPLVRVTTRRTRTREPDTAPAPALAPALALAQRGKWSWISSKVATRTWRAGDSGRCRSFRASMGYARAPARRPPVYAPNSSLSTTLSRLRSTESNDSTGTSVFGAAASPEAPTWPPAGATDASPSPATIESAP